MRIALATSSFLPRVGGVEEHVSFLAHELRSNGHAVTIWAVDQGDATPADDDGTPLRYLPTPLPNRSLRGLLSWAVSAPRAWRAWRRAYRLDRPDVIVIQCFGANGPYATLLARRTNTPLIYSNHGETFMDAHGAFDASALMRRSLRRTLARAAAVVSCSRFAAADLARFGPSVPPTVVGNGIDLDLSSEPVDAQLPARYLAGVGRLVENKGFHHLIGAYAEAHTDPSLAGVDLVIAGDGPERGPLEELAARLGVAERVHFVGSQRRAQIRALLDGAVAHVVPSRVEAFGIVVLEGWRSGIPVIVTKHGGPPEFVTDDVDGLLFEPRDITELARLLIRVASEPVVQRRLGSAGRASAQRFSWRAVSDSYEDVLRAVTADAPADRWRRPQ